MERRFQDQRIIRDNVNPMVYTKSRCEQGKLSIPAKTSKWIREDSNSTRKLSSVMTKYFKRGLREYFMIGPGKGMKIVNKEFVSYITIAHDKSPGIVIFLMGDMEGAIEIPREEFAKEFGIASKLIVLD